MPNMYNDNEDFEHDEEFDVDDEESLIDDEELLPEDKFLRKSKFAKLIKPPRPPLRPPRPPEPVEPIVSYNSGEEHKVIGIRGLNRRLYRKILEKARERGTTVSELMNEILHQYLDDYFESETISGIETLELHEEELNELGDSSIILSDIKRLVIGPNVTKESFSKIREIKNSFQVYVPDRLFLLTLKKSRHCGKIEKYSGDIAPRVVRKQFNSDVTLSKEFFEYFIDSNSQVDLFISGELEIEEDVTLDHLKKVFNYLRVDGDITIPNHLKGWMYAKAECYGDIETN